MFSLGANRGVGAVGEQNAHHLDVSCLGRQEERGGAGQVPAIPRARPPRLLHADAAVDVGAMSQQRFDDAHAIDLHRDELVAEVPVGDVDGGVQRPSEDIAPCHSLGIALVVRELPVFELHRPGAHALHRQLGRAALHIRVGPLVEQEVHEILVSVDHRDEQRRRTVRSRPFDVRSRRHQCANGTEIAAPCCKQKSGRAAVGARVDISAVIDQRLDDRCVASGSGPHQRGLSVPGFLRVDGCAGTQKHRHRVRASGARREHQRGFAGAHGAVWIGSAFQ